MVEHDAKGAAMRVFPLLICAGVLMLPACLGSSSEDTLENPAAPAEVTPVKQGKVSIPLGMSSAQVLKELGPADSAEALGDGREMWRYSGKKAGYVYVSKEPVQTLIIGEYSADTGPDVPGQRLLLTVVIDRSKKVSDFNFALMGR